MNKRQKTDLALGIILAVVGVVFLISGLYEINVCVSSIDEIGDALMKLYMIPGWMLLLIGGASLGLLIELIYIDITKKKPWWWI